MKIIIRGRQMGKTLEMIRMSAENQAVIICHTYSYAKQLKALALSMELDIPDPIVANANQLAGVHANLIIDNADLFLESMFPANRILAISLTGVQE